MDQEPLLKLPDPVDNFTIDFKSLWMEALARPDIDLQRRTSDTIAKAHRFGIRNLKEAIPRLEELVVDPQSHPVVRFSAARALIALESRDSAEKLLSVAPTSGADYRQLVEPVLASWNFRPALEIWKSRLDAKSVRPRDLILAIRALDQTGETSVVPKLRSMVMDALQATDLRLEAATAVGHLAESGLESDAGELVRRREMHTVNCLCAVRLLSRHASASARTQLAELAVESEPTVAAAALRRLNDIDTNLVVPLAEAALKNSDVLVREQGVRSFVAVPTPERMALVSRLLDDPDPQLRAQVREDLFRLAASPELNESVRTGAMEVLAGDHWQGQEQAALLLGALEHQPASARLVGLLESARPGVAISSAWALRKIADPASIPGILDKATRQTAARRGNPSDVVDAQVAHLFEACGRMQARQAEPLLKEYVPKLLDLGERSRSVAIRTLGQFYSSTPNPQLAQQIIERAMDPALLPPENEVVKQHCAIALAFMHAKEHAPALRTLLEGGTPHTPIGLAFRWAVHEMTGEDFPPPEPMKRSQGFWFLEPLPPSNEAVPPKN